MSYFRKKLRLLGFLARRVPRFGLAQVARGMRDRRSAYLAMELADLLPPEVSTIVDVGAHTGAYSEALDFLYSPSRVWVVEPNPEHGAALEERFRGRGRFSVVRACLGEKAGEAAFNVHEFDAASSLFECRPGHLASLGISEGKRAVRVPVITLRDLLPRDLESLDLLKLDCQGSELSVLKGAREFLRSIRWVLCEVSFEVIYQGAPLFGEVHSFLRESGFELRSLAGFSGAGPAIQWADALYANANPPKPLSGHR